MNFIHGAMLGAGVWLGLSIIFGAWYSATAHCVKARRRRPR